MQRTNVAIRQTLSLLLILILPTSVTALVGERNTRSAAQRNQDKKQISATQPPDQSSQSRAAANNPVTGTQKPKGGAGLSRGAKEQRTISSQEKRQKAMTLLETALATAHRIIPVEYGLLVQTEAASLLWQFDNERALSILSTTLEAMRKLLEEEKNSNSTDRTRDRRMQKVRFSVLQKIAALKPDLIQKLWLGKSTSEKQGEAISEEWTEEALAIISVASELIEKDAKLAARLAEQSLSVGRVDWRHFLQNLSEADNSEAERLAFTLLTRFRDSSLGPLALDNLKSFFLAPDRSSKLRDYFFQSLALRIRRDIRPDTSVQELEHDLIAARNSVNSAAAYSPRWHSEFEKLVMQLEALFSERSVPIPGPPRTRMLDVPTLAGAASGDTREIADALTRIGTIRDLRAKDKEYQMLAARAALKADVGLAEDIMARMQDEDERRETTLMVYSPLVRQALNESNWSQAQGYAVKMLNPLARTLALDGIAKAMSNSGADNSLIKEVYWLAEARLNQEISLSIGVAQAFLILAKSLLPLDLEAGITATRSAIASLNRLVGPSGAIEELPMSSALVTWIRLPHYYTGAGEVMDITVLMVPVFREIARRDTEKALSVAFSLANRGLNSLAHMAICRQLLEEANHSPAASKRRKVSNN